MYTAARKLHIIEAVLKTENEAVLKAIENIVGSEDRSASKRPAFNTLLGSLSPEEAEAMKKIIQENFEKISPDEWK